MRDEHGEEMHKSKGNAIPFDEAAEQIGADVMRWMFCAANPAVNLNFGYGPAHEVVRRFFLPLWNTYGFFVTYARLDGWTPRPEADGAEPPPHAARPMDPVAARAPWRRGARARSTATTRQRAARAIEGVRRTSSRTGTSAATGAASGRASSTTTSAPPTPRCTGAGRRRAPARARSCRTWPRRCGRTWSWPSTPAAPDSVHLADFPSAGAAARRTRRSRRRCALAPRRRGARPHGPRRLRREDPAAAGRWSGSSCRGGAAGFAADRGRGRGADAEVLDELNAKSLEVLTDESELVERTLYPLLPVIGPRHGADVGAVMAGARSGDWQLLDDGARRRSAA